MRAGNPFLGLFILLPIVFSLMLLPVGLTFLVIGIKKDSEILKSKGKSFLLAFAVIALSILSWIAIRSIL